jgi:phosphoglycolate phosphatase
MDSIIFDLDGTLWDALDEVLVVFNAVLRRHNDIKNQLSKDDLRGITGLQVKEAGRKLFPYLEESRHQEILMECSRLECQHLSEQGGRLYDNLEDVLKVLSSKYKLVIVSNCQDGYIEAFFKYHKLDKYFIDYENPGRTGLSKGENIKLVIKRNKLASPIYVGDTLGDQQAAEFAGIPFVYAEYGFGEVTRFDYKIECFEELLDIMNCNLLDSN